MVEKRKKVEEEADVWAPHVSECWERSNRGILGHIKIRGSASGSKGIKDVYNVTNQRNEKL